jgi:hypothetical protein
MKVFPEPEGEGLPLASNIEICVEKPVVAPQSRWNSTAICLPSGDDLREATVFWQASEHPEQSMNAANSSGLIGAHVSLGTPPVNDRIRD